MKKFLILILALLFTLPVFAGDITILHTSDIHGRLEPISYHDKTDVGGIARRSAYYKKIRKENKNVLVLDSGDYFQGSLFYQAFKGDLSASLMKYVKYDAIALGNHEFDRGLDELKRLIKNSKTTFLSANLEFSDPYLQKAVKPYIVKDFGTSKVLIIGVTTPKLGSLSNSDGVTIYDPSSVVRKILNEQRADVVIVLSHCGYETDKQIAKANPSVNLILGGHNHLLFERPTLINNVQIVNSGEFGVYVSTIDFNYDSGIKHFENTLMDSSKPSDKAVLRKLKHADKKLVKLKGKILATTNLKLIGEQTEIEHCQTNLGRLVLKSMCGNNPYDIVVIHSGSIRLNRDITGNISLADVYELLPFENSIVSGKIQGKYLEEILKRGKVYGRGYLQVYSKIKNIEDDKFYTIITNSYIAKGKDGFEEFRNLKDITEISPNQGEAFVKLLQENPQIVDETLIMP